LEGVFHKLKLTHTVADDCRFSYLSLRASSIAFLLLL
jgi:hypothetical protein